MLMAIQCSCQINEYETLGGVRDDCEEGITELQVQKLIRAPHFFTTDPTSVDLGFSSGLRGEKPAINGLSCGTTRFDCVIQNNISYFDIITTVLL